jgi:hypothetical protein
MSRLTLTERRDIEIKEYIADLAIFLSVPATIEEAVNRKKYEYLGYIVENKKYKLQMVNIHLSTAFHNVKDFEYAKWYGYKEFIAFMDGVLHGQSKKYLDKQDKIIQKMMRDAEKQERQTSINLN